EVRIPYGYAVDDLPRPVRVAYAVPHDHVVRLDRRELVGLLVHREGDVGDQLAVAAGAGDHDVLALRVGQRARVEPVRVPRHHDAVGRVQAAHDRRDVAGETDAARHVRADALLAALVDQQHERLD